MMINNKIKKGIIIACHLAGMHHHKHFYIYNNNNIIINIDNYTFQINKFNSIYSTSKPSHSFIQPVKQITTSFVIANSMGDRAIPEGNPILVEKERKKIETGTFI